MKSKIRLTVDSLVWAITLLAIYAVVTHAQTNSPAKLTAAKRDGTMQTAAAGNQNVVQGTGTAGRLTKWTGFNNGISSIGDSTIFEKSNGSVGIGTDTPTSKLTVQGMIETTLGGYKFPDGTVQTTAANGLQSIYTSLTLTGDGTPGSPLGVTVPLFLTSFQEGTTAVEVQGGDLQGSQGIGGYGLRAIGGNAANALDGTAGGGVLGDGGNTLNQNEAGAGLIGRGGQGTYGGTGAYGLGGSALLNTSGNGGAGVKAFGGDGRGIAHEGGYGIFAIAGDGLDGAAAGLAGFFDGRVLVHGDFSVTGTKNFKIDHPLDPENKYLYHAAIESSEVLNIYSGNVTTDENGDAIVSLPDWFEAVNRDFRYQLTVLGTFAQAIVGDEIKNNHFKIKTNTPGVKVSWQVTGIRSDAAARKHTFKVEEDKLSSERGYYLAPEAYGQPDERGIEWAHNPGMMQQLKQRRLDGERLRSGKVVDR